MKIKDITGQRYGKLIAIKRIGMVKRRSIWLCLCDCGESKEIAIQQLQSGTKSCGCLQRKAAASTGKKNKTHGMSDTPEWRTWRSLRRRCCDKNNAAYPIYGAKGITVCDRWKGSFENFYADMGPRPSDKHSIDRVDGEKGYSPENCRWATWVEQLRNRPKYNNMIKHNGQIKCAAEWAEIYNVNPALFRKRINKGKSFEEAVA